MTCYPSPGLVSINSNGAHSDMNYYTFIDSTAALLKYLMLIAQTGYSARSSKEIFKKQEKLVLLLKKICWLKHVA